MDKWILLEWFEINYHERTDIRDILQNCEPLSYGNVLKIARQTSMVYHLHLIKYAVYLLYPIISPYPSYPLSNPYCLMVNSTFLLDFPASNLLKSLFYHHFHW